MKSVASEVIAHRRKEKDKKNRVFLDSLLENSDIFPTEDEVLSVIIIVTCVICRLVCLFC